LRHELHERRLARGHHLLAPPLARHLGLDLEEPPARDNFRRKERDNVVLHMKSTNESRIFLILKQLITRTAQGVPRAKGYGWSIYLPAHSRSFAVHTPVVLLLRVPGRRALRHPRRRLPLDLLQVHVASRRPRRTRPRLLLLLLLLLLLRRLLAIAPGRAWARRVVRANGRSRSFVRGRQRGQLARRV
jgi:hypothetical protein